MFTFMRVPHVVGRIVCIVPILALAPPLSAEPCRGPALPLAAGQEHVRVAEGVVPVDALDSARAACLVQLAAGVRATRDAIVLAPGVERALHDSLGDIPHMITIANFGPSVALTHNGVRVEPLCDADATIAVSYEPGDLLSVRSLDEPLALPLTLLPLIAEDTPIPGAKDRVLLVDGSATLRPESAEGVVRFETPELSVHAADLLVARIELKLERQLASDGFADLVLQNTGRSVTLALLRARDVLGDPTRLRLHAALPLSSLGNPKSVSLALRVADGEPDPQVALERFELETLSLPQPRPGVLSPLAPARAEPDQPPSDDAEEAADQDDSLARRPESGQDEGPLHATGLRPPTPQEEAWMRANMVPTGQVRFNELALRRLDDAGIPRPRTLKPVAVGSEVLSADELPMRIQAEDEEPVGLPVSVDNSTLSAFPPIDTQGSQGSCAAFSSTYYVMTHMHCLARGCDAKSGGRAVAFSPAFTYNLINGGSDSGSWFSSAYAVMKFHGSPTWNEFPYEAYGSNPLRHRKWPTDYDTWRAAIDRRIENSGSVSNVNTSAGLAQLKQLLVNGYVLNYATFVYSWNYATIDDDPSTPDDDAFVGEQIVSHVAGNSGGHGMTVVGYDDRIWLDLNENGTVDEGEKGALRIANSWGNWKDGGFTWIAYDALNPTSTVPGAPNPTNRDGCFWYERAYWVTARSSYEPSAVAEVTLAHSLRDQAHVDLGQGEPGSMTILEWAYPFVPPGDGGPYAFDGSSGDAVSATFAIDFSDLAEQDLARSWFIRLRDASLGSPLDVDRFALHDELGRRVLHSTSLPLEIDGETVDIKLEHTLDANPSAQLELGEALDSWLTPAESPHEECAVFEIDLLCGAGLLDVEVSGLDGDADLVVLHESQGSPCDSTASAACHADHLGSQNESCQLDLPRPGRWLAAVRNVDVSQEIDFSIRADVVDTNTPPPIDDLRVAKAVSGTELDLQWTRPGACGTRGAASAYSIHETAWAPADGAPAFPAATDEFDTTSESVTRSLPLPGLPAPGALELLLVIAENGSGPGEALP